MDYIQAIVLAIIEGITEFLPISSTGHMILTSAILGLKTSPFLNLFIISIQFGAILSVVLLYWKQFLPVNGQWKEKFIFYSKLFIGFILFFVILVSNKSSYSNQ